jgi:hypothetical protein
MCVVIAAKKATGPGNAARKNAMRRPMPTLPRGGRRAEPTPTHSIELHPAPTTPVPIDPTPSVATPITPPCRVVHLVEQKVYADLGMPENDDHNNWVLDTGTTNHMTGYLDHFT